jgi:hypothetical protein
MSEQATVVTASVSPDSGKTEIPPQTTAPQAEPETTISDEQAHNMPLADLRKAAFPDKKAEVKIQGAPKITVEQAQTLPLGEVRKAILSAESTQAEPEPQLASEPTPPYEMKQTPEGLELRLVTGEVFKAKTANELLEKVTKSKVDTTLYLRKVQQQQQPTPDEPEQIESQPQLPELQPEPELSLEQESALSQQFMRGVLADPEISSTLARQAAAELFGTTPEQVPQIIQMWNGAATQAHIVNLQHNFQKLCPDYDDSPRNAQALNKYLPANPTLEDMVKAWSVAVYTGDGKRKEAEPPSGVRPPAPPPMPTSGGNASTGEPNPWTMPLADLKNSLKGEGY